MSDQVSNGTSPKQGYVYLFETVGGFFKIGQSIDPEERVKAFASLPFEIRLRHKIAVDDMDYWERDLHRNFAERRARGEWFRLTAEDVAWIEKITTLTKPSRYRAGLLVELTLKVEQSELDAWIAAASDVGLIMPVWLRTVAARAVVERLDRNGGEPADELPLPETVWNPVEGTGEWRST